MHSDHSSAEHTGPFYDLKITTSDKAGAIAVSAAREPGGPQEYVWTAPGVIVLDWSAILSGLPTP